MKLSGRSLPVTEAPGSSVSRFRRRRSSPKYLLIVLALAAGCDVEPPTVFDESDLERGLRPQFNVSFGSVVSGSASAGGAGNITSVTTSSKIVGGTEQLYVAQIGIRTTQTVSSVSGGSGLTWTRVRGKTADRGQVRIEVWQAFGSPSDSFNVTANMATSAETVTLTVARYSGALAAVSDIDSVGTGGTDNSSVSATSTSTGPTPGDIHFVALNARNRTISSGDADYTTRGDVVAGTGGEQVRSYMLDHAVSSPTADTFAATLNNTADWAVVTFVIDAAAPPVSDTTWLSKAQLDARSTSSTYWTEAEGVFATATASWPANKDLDENESQAEIYALAGALAYARLYPAVGADSLQTKVATAIADLVSEGVANPAANSSALGWCRNTGTWVIAADLINLEDYDPTLDTNFRDFLADLWVASPAANPADGMSSLLNGAAIRPNNIGNWCRWSAILIAKYLDQSSTLTMLVNTTKRVLGDTTQVDTLAWNSNQTWQDEPSLASNWRGIVAQNATKPNGDNIDGIVPEDMRRGDPTTYSSSDFPNKYGTVADPDSRYVEEAIDPLLGTLIVLKKIGYPTAETWSDNAVGRAAERLEVFANSYSSKGWVYFTEDHEAAAPLVNYLYSYGNPETPARTQFDGATRGYGFTHWTH